MTFLHVALLWALPLALIPILLHLLTLQRLRTVELSTYRFLFDSYVQQRRRTQFLEALLAFLRMLFILGLIAFLARPVLSGWDKLFPGGGGRDVFLLVDCSASMGTVTEGEPALKRAQDAANAVVSRLAPDDRITLVRVTSQSEEVFSRVALNVTEQQDKISALKVSSTRANYFTTLSSLFGSESRPTTNPLVYVFTDCQSSGWTEVRNQGFKQNLPDATPFLIVNVGTPSAGTNLAVIGDAPSVRQRAIVGLPVQLSARVANLSSANVQANVNFFVNDKVVKTLPVSLKPDKTEVVRFVWEPTEPGVQRCRYEVSGSGITDTFPEDDRFEYALTVSPKVPVVVVNGFPQGGSFDDAALYLQIALTTSAADAPAPASDPAKKPGLAPTREQLKSLDVRTVSEAELTQDVLRDAAVVVLANCGQLNATHGEWLRAYVAEGGGLIVFPGDKVAPLTYNTYILPMPAPLKENLTGLQLGLAAEGDPENADTFERFNLNEIDFSHPVLSIFDKEAGFFRDVQFKKRWPLIPPPIPGVAPGAKPPPGTPTPKIENARVLASFGNGQPALIEGRLGEGRTLLAAFPANTKWTNFPSRCAHEFVPLVFQMVKHVQKRADIDIPSVVPADGLAEFSVASSWAPVEGDITNPKRVQVPLTFERALGRWTATFDRTGDRGFYGAEVRGSRPDQRRSDLAFAVNLAREESDPKRDGEAEFKNLLPNADVTFVSANEEAVKSAGKVGSQPEFWQVIFLLFAIMLVEFVLATMGGTRKDATDPGSERVRGYNLGRVVSRMTGGK